jgi:PRTRC genetic system protein E
MLFQSLQELSQSTTIACFISSEGDGLMKVTVMPKPGKEGENPALSTPLQLVGTPEELDEKFAEVLTSYTASRTSLLESLAASQAVMDAAKKDATEKAAKAVSGKVSQTTARTSPAKTPAVSDMVDGVGESEDNPAQAAKPTSDIDLF